MIHSMTGFGEASAGANGIGFSLELRSLNNKFFKLSCRLPDELAGLEAELEQALRRGVARGSFVLTMKLKIDDERAASDVNENVLLSYLDHLETVRSKVHDQAVNIDLTQLLALPGVLQPAVDEGKIVEEARPIVQDLLEQALGKLKQMRTVEGVSLAEDLSKQLEVILDRLSVIRGRAPHVIDEYHDKLSKRVGELLAKAELKVSEPDLLKEVAIFADRADISEEITRLSGHVDQFREVLAAKADEPAGRTLDFLAQEMLRESNTIGSKCNDAQISRCVVELKSAIDRIKEQVQNVE
ncbi:MAG: YicC family protein [Phycisphaeraceae bacterium]|nr:YicC family protein [Phycisphaeraceae bacterium]